MVKSIFNSILLTVIMAAGLFLCFIIGCAGDLTNSIIFMIIWLVGVSGSGVVSCIVEDECCLKAI